jgi:predicted RNA-binding Zn-ribbon protein involved in translation (DUF1610 family)
MTDFITLACPSCGAKIQVVPGSNRYICDYCGSEHILESEHAPKKPGEVTPSTPVFQSRLIPVPNGVICNENAHGLRITRRWFSLKYIPLAFFCVAWDAFLVFWYGIAFSTNAPWIMVCFPIAHLAVGVGMTYSVLTGFINRTILEVTPGKLQLWHEPLPWTGEIKMDTGDLKQLYAREKTSRGQNGTSYSYELWMVSKDGSSRKLLSGLDSPDVPLYIEQQIESWLHIPDVPVAGELAR